MANNNAKESRNNNLSYQSSGVSIDKGNILVETIKPLIKKTSRAGATANIGGFGGIFDLKAAGFKDPLLVSGSDGVGTKLLIASSMEYHKSIGIDLVAMCANDVVVQGAEPLFFSDYYATGKLSVDLSVAIIGGIIQGCQEAGCALIGGETAEMPGVYDQDHYDLAGFCVGAVERDLLLTSENVAEGDIVLGLGSNGIHSNGFSLVRNVVTTSGLSYHAPAPFDSSRILGHALLEPTRLYVKSCLGAIKTGNVKALAHITGGGVLENIPRVVPDGKSVVIDTLSWQVPAVFQWLKEISNISAYEMFRTFNCGIGMAVICSPKKVSDLISYFQATGEKVFSIGRIEPKLEGSKIVLENVEKLWPSN